MGISTRVTSNNGQGPVPYAGYTATSVMLGEGGASSSSFYIDVLALTAPAGTYTLRLDGVSHTRSHEASAEIIVGESPPSHELELVRYQLSYTGFPTPGDVITLLNNFTAVGPVDVTILNIRYSWDMRSFNTTVPGLPTTLNPGQTTSLSLKFNIPSSATLRPHTIQATVSWEYYSNGFWTAGNPITVNGTITLRNTSNSIELLTGVMRSSMFLPAIIAYLITAAAFSMLFFVRERRRRLEANKNSTAGSSGETAFVSSGS